MGWVIAVLGAVLAWYGFESKEFGIKEQWQVVVGVALVVVGLFFEYLDERNNT